ncbi:MAG: diguanylate cyclase [Dehalococcoidia bacterium]
MTTPASQAEEEGSTQPVGNDDEVEAGGLPSSARAYLAAVYVTAIGVGAFAILAAGGRPGGQDLAAFAILSGLAAGAQIFKVDAPNRHSYHTTPAFLLAAVLLLDPSLLVPMGLIILLPEWARYRYPWYIQTFNIATYLLNMLAAWAVFHAVAGQSGLNVSWQVAAGTGLAAATFIVINHALVGLVLWLARGIPLRESHVFERDSLETDTTLLLLGAGMAVFWTINSFLMVLGVAPLLLFYRALHVPQLQEEAYYDMKTGLLTARRFHELLREELAGAERSGRTVAVLMSDLDLLRDVNNTHGHLVGDQALEASAKAIKRCLRPGDLAGRLGGEEFALLLPATDPDTAFALAERVREEVAAAVIPLPDQDEPLQVTMSLGVATFPDPCPDAGKLLHHADMAVYRSKLAGRNCTSAAIPSLDEARFPEGSYRGTLESLAFALDTRGSGVDGRTLQVTALALALASELGIAEGSAEWNDLERACLLHDVGKFAIASSIIFKTTSLTEEEWAEMKRHSDIGWHMLRQIENLKGAADIVHCHHEHNDGSGYPRGLRGEEIPRGARIFAVADAFDAITSDRPYRDARSHAVAVDEIIANSGTQFDPQVVDALLRVMGYERPRQVADISDAVA